MYKLDSEKAEEPDIKLPASVGFFYDPTEAGTLISGSLTTLTSLTVWITTNSEKFVEMGIPDHLTCLLRSLYPGQKATVRTRHGTMN